jgi:nitroreductase
MVEDLISPGGALWIGENRDIFHIMKTNRPMRRLKPDPVPQALLQKILDAASCAPNSMNTQPYEFLVVRDTATKTLFGERYHTAMQERLTPFIPADDDNSRHARNFRAAFALGKRIWIAGARAPSAR